jgi:hypothetical protein
VDLEEASPIKQQIALVKCAVRFSCCLLERRRYEVHGIERAPVSAVWAARVVQPNNTSPTFIRLAQG